jgi:hypothetical protein
LARTSTRFFATTGTRLVHGVDYRSQLVRDGVQLLTFAHRATRSIEEPMQGERTQCGYSDGLDRDANRRRAISELNLCRALSWAGLVRMADVMDEMSAPLHIPPDLRAEFAAMENRTGHCAGDLKEFVGFEADIAKRELAELSTQSSFRTASSGHAIPFEAPDAIVEAVRDIVSGQVGS